MKKILAVSGGVDSMVMLDLFRDEADVVAHFNHGTRGNSDEDEDFVRRMAGEYGVEFRSRKENLGAGASEAWARERRYGFLKELAEEYGGEIYVAHHADDLAESVVINILRGTGWRGLAPMMAEGVQRPLLGWDKKEIHKYAAEHEVRWRQDPTNTEDDYLRNRVRRRMACGKSEQVFSRLSAAREKPACEQVFFSARSPVSKIPCSDFRGEIIGLISRQREIAREIDGILEGFLPPNNVYERGWFRGLDDAVAVEILRAGLGRVGRSATRPQLRDFLAAIREYGGGKAFNLPGDYLVRFRKNDFVLE